MENNQLILMAFFQEQVCPCCNKFWEKSDTFYLIKLSSKDEEFYKLGISYATKNGDVRRFRDYKNLGFTVTPIYIHTFDDAIQCKEFETKLKRIIKDSLYIPKKWDYERSTETFTDNLLPTIKNIIKQDIVSTSDESQSSSLENAPKLTTQVEDNTL